MSDLYQKIQENPKGFPNPTEDYIVYYDNGGHVVQSIQKQNFSGWKFYLSISPDDMKKAVNIVSEIMMGQEAFQMKVLDQSVLTDLQKTNKAIILFDSGVQKWDEILPKIETQLRAADVKSGLIYYDKQKSVKGSMYMTYANELVNYFGKLKPFPANARETYNDSGLPDPFINLAIGSITKHQGNTRPIEKPHTMV